MSELTEVALRHDAIAWQSRQSLAGITTFLLVFLTLGSVMMFLVSPSPVSAGILAGLMVSLVLSSGSMITAATRVVQLRNGLPRARARAGIIDVEVVEPFRPRLGQGQLS